MQKYSSNKEMISKKINKDVKQYRQYRKANIKRWSYKQSAIYAAYANLNSKELNI